MWWPDKSTLLPVGGHAGDRAGQRDHAWLGVRAADRRQQDDLARVVATLTEAAFPLWENVLRQMSGLSGAQFVLFAPQPAPGKHASSLEREEWPRSAACRARGGNETILGPARPPPGGQSYLRPDSRHRGGPPPGPVGSWCCIRRPVVARARQAAYPTLLTGGGGALAVMLVTTVLARRFVRPIGNSAGRRLPSPEGNSPRRSARRRNPRPGVQ